MAEQSLHGAPQLYPQGELPFEDSYLLARPVPTQEFQQWAGYQQLATGQARLDSIRHGMTWPARFAAKTLVIGGLSGVCAAGIMHQFPHSISAEGVPFKVEGSLIDRPGFSADTTFGSWEFPHVDGLPIGVHISPQNVNLLTIARNASPDAGAYADKLQHELEAQKTEIGLFLGGELVVGALGGLLLATAGEWLYRQARSLPKREHEFAHRSRQLAASTAVMGALAAYGVASYNPNWVRDSHLTGTLAGAQGLKGDFSQFYSRQSKASEVLQTIFGVQASLQEKIDAKVEPPAFNVMYISDMHMGTDYPLLAQYAEKNDVKLIINTGDESNFGTRAEMTAPFDPAFIPSVTELTKQIPMIWVAGNHDSPETIAVMRSIPGVKVVGVKEQQPDGTFKVGAQVVKVYGLNVGGLPDPRVYGGQGASGSNDGPVTQRLENVAVDGALKGTVGKSTYYDIFTTHEPVAGAEIAKLLAGHVRQLNMGHLHQQNKAGDIQKSGIITLVEGSSSGGGILATRAGSSSASVPISDEADGKRSPIEFTIASFAADCQETKLLRFQLGTQPNGTPDGSLTMDTIYLKAQKILAGRICSVDGGIGPVQDIIPGMELQAQAAGK